MIAVGKTSAVKSIEEPETDKPGENSGITTSVETEAAQESGETGEVPNSIPPLAAVICREIKQNSEECTAVTVDVACDQSAEFDVKALTRYDHI